MYSPKTNWINACGQKFPDRIKFLETILDDTTIVYIDFANVRGWLKKLGWSIDLRKLKDLLDSFSVVESRFYFGTIHGDQGSEKFMKFVHSCGYKMRTKRVKIMKLSIDVTSISAGSPDILTNFIDGTLLKNLRVDVIQYLNNELKSMNKQGTLFLECPKCNFDVEIGSDMRLDNHLKRAQSFCLWSGDSDFHDPLTELLDDHKKVSVVGTARHIAAEINSLKGKGLNIFDLKKIREFIEKKQ
jgi:uncharacterized LabA/DUF88 family protein